MSWFDMIKNKDHQHLYCIKYKWIHFILKWYVNNEKTIMQIMFTLCIYKKYLSLLQTNTTDIFSNMWS